MKIALLALFTVILATQLSAQKIEVSAQVNSGLFHYDGTSATSNSFFIEGETDKQDYTNNPYGSKNGFSYGGDVQAQYVSKSGFITGVQAGYEILRSEVDINSYYPSYIEIFYLAPYPSNINLPNNTNPFQVPVKGQAFLRDEDININPYIGYRLKIKKIKIDIMPGIDLGFNINSYDKGKATAADGTVYQTDFKKPDAPTDVRLRFGVAATYKRFGITAAYAYGLTNLEKNMIGGASYNLHSELVRFGVTYRIF